MKQFLLLLLAFLSAHGAPAGILPQSSCKDATTVFVAEEAINKINQDRTTGYVFSLERVSNVHYTQHGETGVVFYLTIDILETTCHVLSKKNYKECEHRNTGDNPLGMLRMYRVEFIIQETICSNKTDISKASTCDLMPCEFAHKGLCKTTHTIVNDNEFLLSNCEIYEPQAAEEEKKNHMQAGEIDHHHDHTHEGKLNHDHSEDHVHTHTHEHNKAQGHAHSHAHSHDHDHDHDHVHAHHDQAHNHTQDKGVHHAHHNYGHTEGQTHEHDHELALDHEHKHGHLHEHEHHHHHHQHAHETTVSLPKGSVQVLPSLDKPITLPSFPDLDEKPSEAVGFPLHPDPQIPGQMEPVIGEFPNTLSPNCPAEFQTSDNLIQNAFAEDPVFKFKPAA
ncbi:Fetuin-B [Bagarius yarrelli]|uniref:Fetuin-B n=1 Tax=Bagarius yarrelli TaxID=175774 RepID=A0A556TRX0_BAGYA|nr:Fetuin-B [Bagarius yarrelli]